MKGERNVQLKKWAKRIKKDFNYECKEDECLYFKIIKGRFTLLAKYKLSSPRLYR